MSAPASSKVASPTLATSPTAAEVPTLKLMRRLFAYKPALFAFNVAAWSSFHTLPAIFSYFVSRIFAHLGEAQTLGNGALGSAGQAASVRQTAITAAWLAVAYFAAARFARFGVFYFAVRAWFKIWFTLDALLRRNLLAHLLLASGSRRLPDTPAEAVSRFRDDVDDVAANTEAWIDAGGFLLYSMIAITLMWQVDSTITLVICAPLLLVIVFVQRLTPQIRSYRRRMRQATARVTDFIGETFGAVSAVKLSARETQMVGHLSDLGETRKAAALKDVLLTELIKGVNINMINLGVGAVLLLGANLILGGRMTIGDFVLFFALLPRLTGSMGYFGDMIARHRRTGVSFERMQRLLQDAPMSEMVAHHPLYLDNKQLEGGPPAVPPRREAAPFESLQVRHLSAVHDSGRGILDASFDLKRGEFVVITGRIGSGKSTLVRALLGLIPAGGEITWNGDVVSDPASFFVPPRSAYTAQLPQLFSDSLRDNVLMGAPDEDGSALAQALKLAVMQQDLSELPQGLSTQVGARGVKLSGGQLQRSAVARMLAQQADLLIFDDVSSALDAETERQLWAGLAGELPDATCLVVSHRRAALLRADRIIVLDEGRVVDQGQLGELLSRSAQMQALWSGEVESAEVESAETNLGEQTGLAPNL
ncbi:ABC transporter ATP-binding protein [Deinococcus detaillensis]|uniref:ABC transporter ATP-binding protein n=1 Tax=Deinococcus detaillensis TaxID=2592048 RepID=A0A553UQE3_9DEIO|nr:ABC transporter ATP-binding protein [Deinococcus detaillensis]TSA82439.1 ABC transporter ATP-binding protein [Deinococcus detaillensis]